MMDVGSLPASLLLLLHLLLLLLLLLTPCLCNQHVFTESGQVKKEPTATHLPTPTPLKTTHLSRFPGHGTKAAAKGQPPPHPATSTIAPFQPQAPDHSTAALKGCTGGESPTAGTPCTDSTSRVAATRTSPLTPATAMLLLVAIVLFVGLLHFKVGAEIRRCWDGVTCECCRASAFSSCVVHRLKLALLVPASALGKRKNEGVDVVQSFASGQVLVPVVTVTGDGDSGLLSSVVYVDQERV